METKAVDKNVFFPLTQKKQANIEDTSFASLLMSLFSDVQSSNTNFNVPVELNDGLDESGAEISKQVADIKFIDINANIFAAHSYGKQNSDPISCINTIDLQSNLSNINRVAADDINGNVIDYTVDTLKLDRGSMGTEGKEKLGNNDMGNYGISSEQRVFSRITELESYKQAADTADYNTYKNENNDIKVLDDDLSARIDSSKLLEVINEVLGNQTNIAVSMEEIQGLLEKYLQSGQGESDNVYGTDKALTQTVSNIFNNNFNTVENVKTESGITFPGEYETTDVLDSIISFVNQKLEETGSLNSLSRHDMKVLVQRISQPDMIKGPKIPAEASVKVNVPASEVMPENKTYMDSKENVKTAFINSAIYLEKNDSTSEVHLASKANMDSGEGDKIVFDNVNINMKKPESSANNSPENDKNLITDNSIQDHLLVKMDTDISFNGKSIDLRFKKYIDLQQESILHSVKLDKNEKDTDKTIKFTRPEQQFMQITRLSSKKDGKEPISSENESLKAIKEESQSIKTDFSMEDVKGFSDTGKGDVKSLSPKTEVQREESTAFISKPEDIMEVVAKRFKFLKFPDSTELKVKLKPEELGEIVIKVVLEKGQINGNVLAEKKEVVLMLQNQLDTLKQDLKNNNINLNNISVNISSQQESMDRGSSGAYSHNQRRHQNRGHNELVNESIQDEKFEGIDIIA